MRTPPCSANGNLDPWKLPEFARCAAPTSGWRTAIEALLRCDANELSLADMPGLKLACGLVSRISAHCARLVMREPPRLQTRLRYAALNLQIAAGCPVTFSRSTQTVEHEVFQVVVEYTEEAVGRLAFSLAAELCRAAAADARPLRSTKPSNGFANLMKMCDPAQVPAQSVDAGRRQGIPYRRLTEGSLVQLGWGSRQRRIQAAETDRSSAIAESIAQDKELTS